MQRKKEEMEVLSEMEEMKRRYELAHKEIEDWKRKYEFTLKEIEDWKTK